MKKPDLPDRKRTHWLPKWMVLLAVFVLGDFGARQIYLWQKAPVAPTGVSVSKNNPPASESSSIPTPENDPQFLGGSPLDGRHPYYHHGLPILQSKEESWRGVRYIRHTNRLGFRDQQARDVSLRKKGFRILLIGDSNIYGVGLPWEQTMAGRLAAIFPQVEVLNASVPSYFPSLEESKLRYLMGRHGLEVDAVILFVVDSADIDDELSFFQDTEGCVSRTGPQFSELPANKNWADHLEKFLQEKVENHFVLMGALVRNARQWIRRHCSWGEVMAYEKGRWAEYDGHLNPWIETGIIRAVSALTRLQAFLQSRNTKLILVVAPSMPQMDLCDPRSRAESIWVAWGKANHVPVVSLFPDFYRHRADYPQLVQGSGHWNDKGQELVAELLAKRLPPLLPQLPPASP